MLSSFGISGEGQLNMHMPQAAQSLLFLFIVSILLIIKYYIYNTVYSIYE